MRPLLAIIGVAIVVGLLWGGGELHYRSCVNTAEANNPVQRPADPQDDFWDRTYNGSVRTRRHAVAGCSRLPW